MEKEMNTSEEELKYQVDLLTASQNRLTESEQLYKKIAECAKDGYYYANLTSRLVLASEGWYDLFPVGKEQLKEKEMISSYIADNGWSHYSKQRAQALEQKKAREEFKYRLTDGRWILQTDTYFYNEKQEICEQISYFENITQKVNQQKELERIAYYDSVTKLYNNSYLTSWLEEGIQRAAGEFKIVQLIYMDVDYFRKAVDAMGTEIGDEIILNLVAALKTFETGNIRIGRFGDDKFAIGITDLTTSDMAETIARTLTDSLCKPLRLSNGTTYSITLSIGIATYHAGMGGAKDLIRAADIAMYKVKKNGRNGICCFQEELRTENDGCRQF